MGGDVLCLDRSAVILAEGPRGKLGEDRGLLKLDGKPLLNCVVDAVKGMVGEVLVVASSKAQAEEYAKVVSSAHVQFVLADGSQGSLAGALAGFEAAQGKYSLLLPFDAPFVSKEVVGLLFDLCAGKSAVVPRWPSSEVESLQAVYCTEVALEAAREALASGSVDLDAVVAKLRGVRYLSTLVVEQLDPDFKTFFRVMSPLDLKKAVVMTKPRKTKSKR